MASAFRLTAVESNLFHGVTISFQLNVTIQSMVTISGGWSLYLLIFYISVFSLAKIHQMKTVVYNEKKIKENPEFVVMRNEWSSFCWIDENERRKQYRKEEKGNRGGAGEEVLKPELPPAHRLERPFVSLSSLNGNSQITGYIIFSSHQNMKRFSYLYSLKRKCSVIFYIPFLVDFSIISTNSKKLKKNHLNMRNPQKAFVSCSNFYLFTDNFFFFLI